MQSYTVYTVFTIRHITYIHRAYSTKHKPYNIYHQEMLYVMFKK